MAPVSMTRVRDGLVWGGGGGWGVGLHGCGMTTVCVAWTQWVLNCLCGCKFTSVAVAWPHWVCHRLSVCDIVSEGVAWPQ